MSKRSEIIRMLIPVATLLFLTFCIWSLREQYKGMESTNASLEAALDSCTAKLELRGLTVTMYQPYPYQTDDTPHILADGTRINPWRASELRYIAVSRDLLWRYGGPLRYGDYVYIGGIDENSGFYQVRDTMNRRFYSRVDILRSRGKQKWFKYTNAVLVKPSSSFIQPEFAR